MFCRHALLSLLTTALLATSAARADVVYSNLGPGNAFDTGGWWSFGGDLSADHFDTNFAASFLVGSNAYTLDSADLPLSIAQGNNLINMRLLSDAAGSPGSVLTSTSITGIPNTATLKNVNFGGTFTLQANTTYWLMADVDGDTYAQWYKNSTGALGLADQSNGDPWTLTPNVAAPAFRINGTLVPSVTPVPLPSAWATGITLLTLALMARVLRRRQTA